jgi:hypothetical protein
VHKNDFHGYVNIDLGDRVETGIKEVYFLDPCLPSHAINLAGEQFFLDESYAVKLSHQCHSLFFLTIL